MKAGDTILVPKGTVTTRYQKSGRTVARTSRRGIKVAVKEVSGTRVCWNSGGYELWADVKDVEVVDGPPEKS